MTLQIITQLLICIAVLIDFVSSESVIVFGGSGAVGSEVLKSVLRDEFFDKVIVIGRQSSFKKIDNIISSVGEEVRGEITKVEVARVEDISTDTSIERADTCLIALGVSAPHHDNLQNWHSVEVDLIHIIAKFCNKIQARSISLLSAVDVEYESAVPFTEEEITSYGEESLGWINMILLYNRVKGLEEKAIIEGASKATYIRLFQPNTIVTEQPRYGWFDTILFRLHGILDRYLPERYHSVDVKLLGRAMVEVARMKLMEKEDITSQDVSQLTYKDYVSVTGKTNQESRLGDEL